MKSNCKFVICQWSVGAKHLEDKLSVIAKNSSFGERSPIWGIDD
ncbi:hypothetical protein [Dolichospermum circinale]|nr:hypothetical protein [Dolichospermum circinale]MDB9449224.1 hypothetical protein [Dolichospermum circinale CS-547]